MNNIYVLLCHWASISWLMIMAASTLMAEGLPKKQRDARVFDPQKYDVKDRLTYCNSLVKLNRRQMAFCIKNPRIVKVFEHGFKMGIQACVDKFRNNSYTRWNCTNTTKKKKTNVFFGVAMAVATKEAAVMQAFGAAGMFMALTSECINGNIPECPRSSMYRTCNARADGSARKSCSVINWDAPRKIFYSFMLTGTGGKYWRQPNRFMTRFDRAIGTVAVMESTIKGCDCSRNGIMTLPCLSSSSCSEQLPVLEDVATNLYDKYVKAKKFLPVKPNLALRATYPPEISGGKTVYIKDPNIPPEVSGKDLIYYRDSPLHCEPQAADNWGGIGGRPCRPDVKAFDSCSILCCGFGYMIIPQIDKKNCHITLAPRLSIKCETQEVYKYYCKFVWMVRRRPKRGKFAVPLSSLHNDNAHLLSDLSSSS